MFQEKVPVAKTTSHSRSHNQIKTTDQVDISLFLARHQVIFFKANSLKLFSRQSFSPICFVLSLSLFFFNIRVSPIARAASKCHPPEESEKTPHFRFSPFSIAYFIILSSSVFTSCNLMSNWIKSSKILSCSNCIHTF